MIFVVVGTFAVKEWSTLNNSGQTEFFPMHAGQSYRVVVTGGCGGPDVPVNIRVVDASGSAAFAANGSMITIKRSCEKTATFAEFWVPAGGEYRISWFVPPPGLPFLMTVTLRGGLLPPLTAWGLCGASWVLAIAVGIASAKRAQGAPAVAAEQPSLAEAAVPLKVARVAEAGPASPPPAPPAPPTEARRPPAAPPPP